MSASKAQRAATAERRRQAVALRMAGVRLDDIVERLGYSGRAAASKDISRALEASTREQHMAAKEHRALELARLDRLQQGLWGAAIAGDPKSAEVVIKITDRRIRLLRLDSHTATSEAARSVIGALAEGLQVAYDALPPADDDGDAPPID